MGSKDRSDIDRGLLSRFLSLSVSVNGMAEVVSRLDEWDYRIMRCNAQMARWLYRDVGLLKKEPTQ
jgi:hypothetical protein